MNTFNKYSLWANHYDIVSFLIRHRYKIKLYFQNLKILKPGMRILDAGCGTGAVTEALFELEQELNFFGFDLTPNMLAVAKQRFQRKKITANLISADVLKSLPIEWQNFDLIVSAGMLEHLPKSELVNALENLSLRLNVTGKLFIFISRYRWLNKFLIQWIWGANLYKEIEIREIFEKAGLEIIKLEKFATWGFAVQALRSKSF